MPSPRHRHPHPILRSTLVTWVSHRTTGRVALVVFLSCWAALILIQPRHDIARSGSDSALLPSGSSINARAVVGSNAKANNDSVSHRSNTFPSSTKKPRVVVIGPVRNAEYNLYRLRWTTVPRLLRHMEIVQFIFYENDSTDNTLQVLEKDWKENLTQPVHVESERNVPGTRTVLLAHARNRLWELVKALPDQSFDYVLSLDMDKVNQHLAHVETCWNGGLPKDWTVCCTNCYAIYYDLWALRTFESSNWVGDRDVMRLPQTQRASYFRHIPALDPPISVKSCFGGAALYNYQQIRHLNLSTYQGLYNNGVDIICEHVTFHEELRKQMPGAKLYIQPTMMNDGKTRARRIHKRNWRQVKQSWRNSSMSYYYSAVRNWD
jgi:hypothetical protein